MNSASQAADRFLCRVMRGEAVAWPEDPDGGFEQQFIDRSRHHGVQALVFDRARLTTGWTQWPLTVQDELASALRAGAAFDMMREHTVTGFLESLVQRTIPFLVIKGDALAYSHYSNSALRSRCDTDLFISYRDIDAVRDALLEADFAVIPPIYKSHQFVGVRGRSRDAQIQFDVHWRIQNAARYARVIDFDDAFERSVEITGRDGLRTLNVGDSLILACVHRLGSEWHDQNALLWLYDIHLLVSSMSESELSAFADNAVLAGVQAACLDGIRQSQQCFHTDVSMDVLSVLGTRPPKLTFMRRFRQSHLGLLIDDFVKLPGARARWDFLKELFLPSRDLLEERYGPYNGATAPVFYIRYVFDRLWNRLRLK